MDHIEKLVRRLPSKLRERVIDAFNRILAGQWKGLDIKRLSGYRDVFRCRISYLRILFAKMPDGNHVIIEIDTRGNIYKKL